jgi:hypothetical protein
MTFEIGSSVFWNEIDGAGVGMWSGVVKYFVDIQGVEYAGIHSDGIIVPTMLRCGINGPNPLSPEVVRPLTMLTLRTEEQGDNDLRAAWEKKKQLYNATMDELYAARLKALRAQYCFVEPGMGVSQKDGDRVYTGVVVSVDWRDNDVLVEGCWPDEAIQQSTFIIDTLVYH